MMQELIKRCRSWSGDGDVGSLMVELLLLDDAVVCSLMIQAFCLVMPEEVLQVCCKSS